MPRLVKLFISMSLDGYIAGPGEDLGFLNEIPPVPGEDFGYAAFCETIDCIFLGRKTYEKVLTLVPEFPHRHPTYVFSRTQTGSSGNIHYYNGRAADLVAELRTQPGKDIYCDGGGELIAALLRDKLVDQMIITLIPVLLGGGTRLFQQEYPKQDWTLTGTRSFSNGLVQVEYARA